MAEEVQETKKKSNTLLIVLIAVVVAIGVGGGGAWFFLKDRGSDAAVETAAKAKADKAAKEAAANLETYSFNDLVLNPSGTGGTRFLSCAVTFVLKNKEAGDAMKARDAEVRDAIMILLGSKTVEQLDGTDKRDGLRAEIMAKVAPMFAGGGVEKVYFPQFVIQ